MKLGKVLLVIVLLSFLVVPLSSYALKGSTADTLESQREAQRAAEDAARNEEEGNKGPEKLGSNETLFAAKPALFDENMVGTINLPASELQSDEAVRSLADFITAGAEGKNVIILGDTKDLVDLVKNKLAQILNLEGIEGERLFFAITTNESLISAVRDLFTINEGAFGLCTGDNLAPTVREALKGAV